MANEIAGARTLGRAFYHRRRARLIGVVAVVTAMTAACGGGSGDSDEAADTFEVSIVSDLTGAGAGLAKPYWEGAVTALDYANSKGGAAGLKIKYKTFDTQSDPTITQSANRSAISAEPVAILQATAGASVAAAMPLLKEAKLPTLGTVVLGYPNYPWLYGAALGSSQLSDSFTNSAAAVLGGSLEGKKIAFIGIDSPATRGILKLAKSQIEEAGGTVVAEEYVPPGTPSFDSGAANIVSKKPEAVLISDSVAAMTMETKALGAAGFEAPIVVSYSSSDDTTLSTIANPSITGGRPYAYATEGSELFNIAKEFGHNDTVLQSGFAQGWIMGQILVSGLEKCGKDCDADKLITALDGLGEFEVPGDVLPYGKLSLSADQHHVFRSMGLYSYDAATKKVVLGDTIELGESVYPTE